MNQYGKTAVRAAKIGAEQNLHPMKAWVLASEEIIKSEESRKKGCPRSAYFGLCEEGLIKGIPSGNYRKKSSASLNKEYAIRAVELLQTNPELSSNKTKLWDIVIDKKKVHNSQMDVVIALFEEGLLDI